MRIDFHTHMKLSKKAPFDLAFVKEMASEAKKAGLDAICLTEHFNTLRFDEVYEQFDRHFPYVDHYYDVNGLKVFPGVEVDIQETGHILLVGTRESVLQLHHHLKEHKTADSFISFRQLLNVADLYNMLKIGAHAFRKSTPLHHLSEDLLERLDALDLNGKDLHANGIAETKDAITQLANHLHLPVVAGSDTHHHFQYGCTYNESTMDVQSIADLKRMIRTGAYRLAISPCLHDKVKAASAIKKLLKSQIVV